MVTNSVISEIGELLKSEYNINAKIGFPSPTESGFYLNEYNALGGDSEGNMIDIQLMVCVSSTNKITAFNQSKEQCKDIFKKIQSIADVYFINALNLGYLNNRNDYVINFTTSENK